VGLAPSELSRALHQAGVESGVAVRAVEALRERGHVRLRGALLELTPDGIAALLDAHAALAAALDPSPRSPTEEECPSVPWLTAIQTSWVEAVSVNYAVEPEPLARLLPPPLEPEIHKGRGWVQILMSSLRDLRPRGVPALFGVCFYQVSYRAAVRYPVGSAWRRGGYFLRSETNHPVMRAVGNALTEFKFHDFGAADMAMIRDGHRLTVGVDPEPDRAGGRFFAVLDTRPRAEPPPGSVWSSLDELHEPLVECYDALGVDSEGGYVYLLTVDRDPWNSQWVHPDELYSECFETGPLGGGVSRLDSVLHFRECRYRWRPLRRERLSR
jgi:uncharacterized protein YqjF (DUF2071 family)